MCSVNMNKIASISLVAREAICNQVEIGWGGWYLD